MPLTNPHRFKEDGPNHLWDEHTARYWVPESEVTHAKKELLPLLRQYHEAIDILLARLVALDEEFLPSESGKPWEALVTGNAKIRELERL